MPETAERARARNAERRTDPAYQESQADYHRRWKLATLYGLSPEEYGELLEAQGGTCAVCGRTPEENGKRLSVDHCHETDVVRGLLCQPCNLTLGHLEVLGENLGRAMEYLGGERPSRN